MYIKYRAGADRRRWRGDKDGLAKDPPSWSCPAYSKVLSLVTLEQTACGLRTRAAPTRAGSASARRYWIVTQYRAGASKRRTARPSTRPPRSRSTTATSSPCSVPWVGRVSPRFPVRRGLPGLCMHRRPSAGVYATIVELRYTGGKLLAYRVLFVKVRSFAW